MHCTGSCALYGKLCTVREVVHCTGSSALYGKLCTVREVVHCTGSCALYGCSRGCVAMIITTTVNRITVRLRITYPSEIRLFETLEDILDFS